MRRLLIADASEAYTSALQESFQSEFELMLCHDGETALETLHSFRPDALILNLMLPYKDGLTVLQESRHRPQVILAYSTFINEYIQQTACGLGIQYLMLLPTVNALRVRLIDMIGANLSDRKDPSIQIATHLHILNFPTHLDGYHQLGIAIAMFAQNPSMLLSKELYPAIARHLGTIDGRAVEHSIRKAIFVAWKRMDPLVWAEYFLPAQDGTLLRPTNKEFISTIANRLTL